MSGSDSSRKHPLSGSSDTDSNKRIKSKQVTWPVNENIGLYMSMEQGFRELLANAYDDNIAHKVKANEVKCEHRQFPDSVDHYITIQNQGSAVTDEDFQIQRSKKLDGSELEPGRFECVIGVFGRGMTLALASLVLNGMKVIYQTRDEMFTVVASHAEEETQEQSANEAVKSIIPTIDFMLSKANNIEVKEKEGEEKQMEDNVRSRMSYRRYQCVSEIAAGHTYTHILVPYEKWNEVGLAWEKARKSFIYYYSQTPFFEVSSKQSNWPLVQVYKKIDVPKDLFPLPSISSSLSDLVDTNKSFDYVFINGMAYLVRPSDYYFSYNFIVSPKAPTGKRKELMAIQTLREKLNEKRMEMEARSINHALEELLKYSAQRFQSFVRSSMAANDLSDIKARTPFLNHSIYKEEADSKKVNFINKMQKQYSDPELVLYPSFIDYLLEQNHSLPFDVFTQNDIKLKNWQNLQQEINNILKEICRQTVEKVKLIQTSLEEQLMNDTLKKLEEIKQAEQGQERKVEAGEDEKHGDGARRQEEEEEVDEDEEEEVEQDEEKGMREGQGQVRIYLNISAPIQEAVRALVPSQAKRILPLANKKCAISRSGGEAVLKISVNQLRSYQSTTQSFTDAITENRTIYKLCFAGTIAEEKLTGFLKQLNDFCPKDTMEWQKSSVPAAVLWTSFYSNDCVPYTMADTLYRQGSNTKLAFKQTFIDDLTDPLTVDFNIRLARRALLYIIARILQQLGLGNKVDLCLSATSSHPTLHREAPTATNLPRLSVAFRGVKDQVIIFDQPDLLRVLRVAATLGSDGGWTGDVFGVIMNNMQQFLYNLMHESLCLSKETDRSKSYRLRLLEHPTFSISSNRPYHALILIDDWGRKFGGIPTFNMRLCESLTKCNWNSDQPIWVTCVTTTSSTHTGEEFASNRFRLITAPDIPGVSNSNDDYKMKLVKLSLVDQQLLDDPNWPNWVDGVFGHDRFSGPIVSTVAKRFQAPSHVFVHSSVGFIKSVKTNREKYGSSEYEQQLKDAVRSADVVIFVGNTGQDLKGHAGETKFLEFDPGYLPPSSKLSTSGTDLNQLISLRKGKSMYLSFVGRIDDPVKNGEFYEKIWEQAHEKDEHYTQMQIGTEKMPEDKGGSTFNSLLLSYSNSEKEMLCHLRVSLCLLLPSKVDSFGLIAAEAIGIHVPFIASKRTGVAQYLLGIQENLKALQAEGILKDDAEVSILKTLIENMVAPVDENDDSMQKWVEKISWITTQTQENQMESKLQLLKKIWPSWEQSIQKLFDNLHRRPQLRN